MKIICSIALVLSSYFGIAQQEILPVNIQITTAVLPAPESKKEEATVYGYNQSGEIVLLRKGVNDLVCIADNPYNDGISVSCYFKSLEPFMSRGRELRKEGKNMKELRTVRAAEVAAGILKMPEAPSMMYVYYGAEKAYNKTTGVLNDGKFRYVVYIPFATSESTGLPTKPHAKGMPWIMDPGTHRAHIMIGPN